MSLSRGRTIERAPGRSRPPTRSLRPRTRATGFRDVFPFTRSAAAASSSATHGAVTTRERPSASTEPRRSSITRTPPAPIAQSVCPSRHGRPIVSEMITPTDALRSSRNRAAISRAEASGSFGRRRIDPSGALLASIPAAAATMPNRFSTICVTRTPSETREATIRTVSSARASARFSAGITRPSALDTILDVTTNMSPS